MEIWYIKLLVKNMEFINVKKWVNDVHIKMVKSQVNRNSNVTSGNMLYVDVKECYQAGWGRLVFFIGLGNSKRSEKMSAPVHQVFCSLGCVLKQINCKGNKTILFIWLYLSKHLSSCFFPVLSALLHIFSIVLWLQFLSEIETP